MLRQDPENPLRHDAVASLYLDGSSIDAAIAEFRESLRLNPASAPTQYNLGFALSARGRRDEARRHSSAALRIDPDYAQAHNNLGALLQIAGQTDAALEHYARAVALRPDNVEARTNFGQLLANRGRPSEAAAQFRRRCALETTTSRRSPALRGSAATASDPSLRRRRRPCGSPSWPIATARHQNVIALDALAAAYATAGRYDEAVRAARTGLNLATAGGAERRCTVPPANSAVSKGTTAAVPRREGSNFWNWYAANYLQLQFLYGFLRRCAIFSVPS